MNTLKPFYLLLVLSLFLAGAIGYIYYERGKEHVVIEGRFIEFTVDVPPETLRVAGRTRIVSDTTAYQRYLDSLYRSAKTDSSTWAIIDSLSRPFGATGKTGRVSYKVTAYPQLDMRSITSIFDLEPFTLDTLVQDTTKHYYPEEQSHPTWWEFIAFILGILFGGLF